MKRQILAATAVMAGIVSLTAVAVPPPVIQPQIQPNLRPGLDPRMHQLPRQRLRKVCADLRASGLRVANVRRNPDGSFNFSVMGTVRNHGPDDFRSSHGQQSITISQETPGAGSRTLNTWNFTNMRANTGNNYYSRIMRNWRLSTEFPPSFTLRINYDPDIYIDGNPDNDDCNQSNNSKTLTGAEINAVLSRR